ncbi:MAG: ketoacyl-ACP synthase III [Deferribacteres bacterium]|nr:ketoacyl-ACP synthase III [candidate division KSB1 bacterium]MCB9504231.1 ketoacyl-ACP synthase III [Deferribacteres bacterium]
MENARIIATAFYAPDRVITNSYFNDLLGEDVDSWLRENLTIRERHWCAENESTADLSLAAAQKVLQKTGLRARDIDLIIVATDTPEYISPSTASVVQYRLQAENAATFDLNTACAGFVTALDVGAKYIRADEHYKNVLVIGAYAMSKYLDLQDKKTVTLFADGAGAVILQRTRENHGFLGSQLLTKGQYHDWMGIYAGGTHQPVTEQILARKQHLLQFVKKFPKEINPETWTAMIKNLSEKVGVTVQKIDKIFFTQININSIRETVRNLGLTMDHTHVVMDRYGYTGSACIPMALAEADAQNKIKPGDLVFFMGSGGGLAFAVAAFRW